MCSGYYDYAGGYMPGLAGDGEISRADRPPTKVARKSRLQRQARRRDWQRSHVGNVGAAMAEAAAHVYMLQRSPSYVLALSSQDAVAGWLREKCHRARLQHCALEKCADRHASVSEVAANTREN